MNKFSWHIILTIVLYVGSLQAWAQRDTLSYAEQFELLAKEMDSLSIFTMIDSILSIEPIRYSELNIRAAYSSNVVSAGRNYGINQHGLSPGISFYHKSGLFADATGYWNSAFDPKYNLTLFSIGYFGTIKKFSFIPSYEKWIYNNDTTATLSNNLDINLNQDLGPINFGVDYSYLFGKESAHRLIGSLSGYLSIKDVWIIDRISFMPSISVLLGNDEVTEIRFTDLQGRIDNGSIYNISNAPEWRQRRWLRERFQKLRDNNRISQRLLNSLINYENNLDTYGSILSPQQKNNIESKLFKEENKNVFGLMNWSFSIPVIFTIKNFSISLSYSYNIPQALPGEEFEFDPISYFSSSITYKIPFKK